MDIGFNSKSWTCDPVSQSREFRRPEWYGLRTRLATARVAGRAFAEELAANRPLMAGSFDRPSARLLADYASSFTAINPVFWANRKSVGDMGGAGAGEIRTGGRGQ